jgi:hypothetical protein
MSTGKGSGLDSNLNWTRSARCSINGCVEVAIEPDQVLVRDSKDPDGGTLAFDRAEWVAFIDGVRDGQWTLDSTDDASTRTRGR